MNKKQTTIDTYNTSAEGLADKFNKQGARVLDIKECFSLVKKENPKVLEIGCGNGRDAEEITKQTNDYLGIDVSEKLIELARQKVPFVKFQVADIEGYEFPASLDIIFAFASLIHVPKESFKKILEHAYTALTPGGIFRISLKYTQTYAEITKDDEYGTRTYYHYSQEDMEEIKGGFEIKKNEINELRGQEWLEITLQK